MPIQRSRPRAVRRQAVAIPATLALAVLPVLAVGTPSTAEPAIQVLGSFETGMDGWSTSVSGSATVVADRTTQAHGGDHALSLEMTYGGDGDFVSLSKGFTPVTMTGVSFWVASAEIEKLTVRFYDANNETHQQEVWLEDTADWQQVTIADLGGGINHGSWGGDGDGVFQQPATFMSISSPGWGLRAEPRVAATLLVDDIEAQVGEVEPPAGIELTPLELGNVFTGTQAPVVGLDTAAAEVTWRLADAYGTVVSSGSALTASLAGQLAIPDPGPGFFRLTVADAAGVLGQATTTLARLSEFDVASVDETMFGAATHFAASWDSDIIPLIADAGIKRVRDEAYWSHAETVPGQFTWPTRVAEYRDTVRAEGLDLLLVLSYGNEVYGADGYPVTDAGRAAFTRYALAAAEFFGTETTDFEIWNEWNIAIGGLPSQYKDAGLYYQALRDTSAALKAAYPDATVIGPATAGVDPDWMGSVFAAGGLDYLDQVSLHPYTYPNPAEGLEDYLTTAEQVVSTYAGGRDVPLVISEMGYPTGTGARSMSDISQAANHVRAGIIALSHEVANYTVYDFKDDGTNPADTEQRFGLVHNEADPEGRYTPKPAYVAVATMTRELTGWDYAGSDRRGNIWDYRFTDAGATTRVAWATTPATVSYSAPGPVTLTTLYGAKQVLTPDAAGLITVTLGSDPIYLTGMTTPAVPVRHGLAVGSALRGVPVPVMWTVDNTMGAATAEVELALGGVTQTASVPAGQRGEVAVELPAFDQVGDYRLTATIRQDGAVSGRLEVVVQVVDPLSIGARHVVDDDGEQFLEITVSNSGTADVVLDKVGGTIEGQSHDGLAGATVAASSTRSYRVPLAGLDAGECLTGAFAAIVGGADLATWSGAVCGTDPASWYPATHHRPARDGSTDDLADMPVVDLASESIADLGEGGRVWFTYDDAALYLTAEIKDAVHVQEQTGVMIWNGDSIQLAVAQGAPGEAAGQRWSELGFALTANGPEAYRWFGEGRQAGVPDADVRITRDEDAHVTLYEVAIGWEELAPAAPGDGLVAAALAVNDNDGQGRQVAYEWGTGIANEKTTTGFHTLRLLPASDPEPTESPTTPAPSASESASASPSASPSDSVAPVPTSATSSTAAAGQTLPVTGSGTGIAVIAATVVLAAGAATLAWRRRARCARI